MNEHRLAELLDDATRPEPPMGPVVSASMLAGDRLRWRRRIQATAAVAAVAAFAAAIPAFAFRSAPEPAGPAAGHRTGVAFIATSRHTVVPVNLATGRARQPIRVPAISGPAAAGPPIVGAPGGTTIWITGSAGLLTPISVRTGRAGTPIPLHPGASTVRRGAGVPETAVITDHGRRAYVATIPRGVLAVDLTSRKVLADIRVPYPYTLAASSNGKLVYVGGAGGLTVISAQTNTVVRTVKGRDWFGLWVAPDGTTVYSWTAIATQSLQWATVVVRVDAATGATSTFTIKNARAAAMAPNGSLLYAAGDGAMYAVSPVTGTIVARWPLAESSAVALAVSPNGSTAYVLGYTPARKVTVVLDVVNLRTGRTVRRISVPGAPSLYRGNLSLSPDGRTVYVEVNSSAGTWHADAIDATSGRLIASTRLTGPATGAPDAVAFGR
jgi:hypothetical protein